MVYRLQNRLIETRTAGAEWMIEWWVDKRIFRELKSRMWNERTGEGEEDQPSYSSLLTSSQNCSRKSWMNSPFSYRGITHGQSRQTDRQTDRHTVLLSELNESGIEKKRSKDIDGKGRGMRAGEEKQRNSDCIAAPVDWTYNSTAQCTELCRRYFWPLRKDHTIPSSSISLFTIPFHSQLYTIHFFPFSSLLNNSGHSFMSQMFKCQTKILYTSLRMNFDG